MAFLYTMPICGKCLLCQFCIVYYGFIYTIGFKPVLFCSVPVCQFVANAFYASFVLYTTYGFFKPVLFCSVLVTAFFVLVIDYT